jgi:Tfp pilus assembly protein FimV
VHIVKEGETIWSIAGQHFRPHPRPAGLWWSIADFQPNPIHDPTIRLVPGSVLILPSLRTVLEEVLGEARRKESRL